MSCLELDLSRVASAREIHVALAALLGFPDGYGHDWDAFWDLISSTHPLPEQLAIRGLDHVERAFPREAEQLLTCLGDYNNDTGRICRSRVTDDYDGRLFFLSYAAERGEDAPVRDVPGAIINCYIKAESARKAHALATERLARDGWKVTSHREVAPVDLTSLADEDEASLIRQACIDGRVFHVFTYSQLEEEEEEEEEPE